MTLIAFSRWSEYRKTRRDRQLRWLISSYAGDRLNSGHCDVGGDLKAFVHIDGAWPGSIDMRDP